MRRELSLVLFLVLTAALAATIDTLSYPEDEQASIEMVFDIKDPQNRSAFLTIPKLALVSSAFLDLTGESVLEDGTISDYKDPQYSNLDILREKGLDKHLSPFKISIS